MSANKKYTLCISCGALAPIVFLVIYIVSCFCFHTTIIEETNIVGRLIIAYLLPLLGCIDHTSAPLAAAILIFVSLIQWPIYGWMVGSGLVHRRLLRHLLVLASIHVVLVVGAFWFIAKFPYIELRVSWHM
jgi:hypothetical protein